MSEFSKIAEGFLLNISKLFVFLNTRVSVCRNAPFLTISEMFPNFSFKSRKSTE